jgi:hypothetical protein
MSNLNWVSEGDPFWRDEGWDKSSVAKVTREEDSIDVYVSVDNERLNQLISRAQRRDTAAVDVIKNFYLEHISYHALLADLDRTAESIEGKDPVSSEADIERELKHACDTICGIMDSLFEVLITTPATSSEYEKATASDIALAAGLSP